MTSNRIARFALIACLAVSAGARAAVPEAEKFYGQYEGEAISNTGGTLRERDLRVEIGPHEKGFTVRWISVTRRASGRLKRKEYTIDFYRSGREHIYASGMRRDMFGNPVPMDPMKGDPYVWARIDGDTLTVYALHVLEDGGYELQTYDRTVIPEGLRLEYSRVRDGEIFRSVTGVLRRVE